ncbi:hypothetical protein SAMN05660776_1572 [Salegentibacter holothuriorum]|uniref:Uncharacterized protein n=1 Tax=Salegentibacter holothuriorum TaxID=241145 RepID=A0A1T5BX92_9FLAO|nr:hypothetical protein [Salegentibacter holothuriorum]SKB51805.1 hypothetical protein SAMN05660776_1572 [Salegentibacter holothuriorum]
MKLSIINLFMVISFFTSTVTGDISKDKITINYNSDEIQRPPKFVLTEINGRELEERAFFTIKYDNTFELKLSDGTIFKYVPYKHFGDEPLCNIAAKDKRGLITAICIKKLSGNKVKIMIENDEMISNFKGYKQ